MSRERFVVFMKLNLMKLSFLKIHTLSREINYRRRAVVAAQNLNLCIAARASPAG